MNANQIIDKILSDARRQADVLLRQAEDHRDQQTRTMNAELEAYREETDRLAKASAEDCHARLLAAARMQNARDLLAAKNQILDDLFARVKQRIEQLADNDYLNLMKRLLEKSVQTGQEKVIIGTHEKRINQAFIDRMNLELNLHGGSGLHLSETREPIEGGFILSLGKVRTNCSTEVLVTQLRDNMELELADTLF